MSHGSRKSRFSKTRESTPAAPSLEVDTNDLLDYEAMDLNDFDTSTDLRSVSKKRARDEKNRLESRPLKKADLKKLMEAEMEAALSRSIPEQNKGYKLLVEKFGFSRESGGLGRQNKGEQEPIPVNRRAYFDKSGVGHIDEATTKRERAEALLRARESEQNEMLQGFITNKQLQNMRDRSARLIAKAERIIHELDCRNGIDDNEFWPESLRSLEISCASSRDERKDGGHSGMTTGNEEDVLSLGDALRHADPTKSKTDDNEQVQIQGENNSALAQYEHILEERLAYLADKYFYCIHCGCAYESVEDLQLNCPGPSEEDH
jgi:Domain of unknown function (DUF4187)